MNSRVDPSSSTSGADLAKYALAILLVAGGVFAFYWFQGQWPVVLRGMLVVAAIAAAIGVVAVTAKGRQGREFVSESLFELRKVVWPTRQETLRITGVILLVVVIVSLILSAFDLVISWVIRLLLGQ